MTRPIPHPATPPADPATIAFLPPSIPPANLAQIRQALEWKRQAEEIRNLARQTMPGGTWNIVRLAIPPVETQEPL